MPLHESCDNVLPLSNPFTWHNSPRMPKEEFALPGGHPVCVQRFRNRVDPTLVQSLATIDGMSVPMVDVDTGSDIVVFRTVHNLSKDDSYKVCLTRDRRVLKFQPYEHRCTQNGLLAFAKIETSIRSKEAYAWREKYKEMQCPLLALLAYSHPFADPERPGLYVFCTLTEYLRPAFPGLDGGLSFGRGARIVRDVISGLEYLHKVCHLVHSDITCDNVLVADRGRFIIANFNSAHEFLDESGTGMRDPEPDEDRIMNRIFYAEDWVFGWMPYPRSDIKAAALLLPVAVNGFHALCKWVDSPITWDETSWPKRHELLLEM